MFLMLLTVCGLLVFGILVARFVVNGRDGESRRRSKDDGGFPQPMVSGGEPHHGHGHVAHHGHDAGGHGDFGGHGGDPGGGGGDGGGGGGHH